eukprot:712672_1
MSDYEEYNDATEYLCRNLGKGIAKNLFWSSLTSINPAFGGLHNMCSIYDMANSANKIVHDGKIRCDSKNEALKKKKHLEMINLGFNMTGYALSGVYTSLMVAKDPVMTGVWLLAFSILWTVAKVLTQAAYLTYTDTQFKQNTGNDCCDCVIL